MKKSVINSAVMAALGVTAGVANAAAVTTLTLKDVGSNTANGAGNYSAALDGISGSFQFKTNYINVGTYNGADPFFGDVNGGVINLAGGANPTGSFSTGFLFSGSPFIPFTFGSGINADVTAGALTVSTLDWGGLFDSATPADFLLPPDALFPTEVLWTNATDNTTDFNVAFRWGHDITSAEDPSLMFTAFTAQWVLEGCVSTVGNTGDACGASTGTTSPVPVPAAVWLFGSGLAGIAGVARRRKARKS